ncbi:SAM-dependent DNA methyltransferase [Chloracidobacterium validum]|uniref:SAM-dependent DNA methyltransferase n=1 Tax=Chloracidobacterium validum TaxID=2821543 RepID=A0ABX8BBL6_9BACT|nr:SAM-dependent DNA methyltransferase [Chloracidobacterium validum]QUW04233.1 SAM-dependent DNA methyltransferase [Chloracidobacterium validum]
MRDQKQRKAEFGDFQTPIRLARAICSLIARIGFHPVSILEPTCGTGSFLEASLETFPSVRHAVGFDINPQYVAQARQAIAHRRLGASVEVRQSDFFLTNWSEIGEALPEPILIIGNPPWITNSALGILNSNNVPTKSNLDNFRGIDALTGRSNFDISEWMIRRNIEWLNGRNGLLAMLCKTAVARKVLLYAWQKRVCLESTSIYVIDAQEYFGASVDACLLLVRSNPTNRHEERKTCPVFRSIYAQQADSVFGFEDGMLVADVKAYLTWKDLAGAGFKGWRSGIKHDCSKVFELRVEQGDFVNGFGNFVELEPQVCFPLLKSSDLAAQARKPSRYMVVPQRTMRDDVSRLKLDAPKTWQYLTEHAYLLDKRKSSIYRNRPRFSIFGVGPYSFAPWKIAISGLYKKLEFVQVSPFQGSPVVLDDTCYFLPCQSEEACNLLYELVTSAPAKAFWSALIFWDAKRPISAQLLNLLDLRALARRLGKERESAQILTEWQLLQYPERASQRLLFREETTEDEGELGTNETETAGHPTGALT